MMTVFTDSIKSCQSYTDKNLSQKILIEMQVNSTSKNAFQKYAVEQKTSDLQLHKGLKEQIV